MSPLGKILALVRVLALDQGARRGAIFSLTLVSLGMLFLGATVFEPYLAVHVWMFLGYWLVCAWLTLTFMLLALYDMLVLIVAGRKLRRDLERGLNAEQNSSTKPPSSTTSPDP
ncbi:hypothetical protein BH09VER1_BH09VER1_09280 [soil metagenome]